MPTATSSSARPLALVTGASTGIGAEFARRLAADGHDLVLVARSYSRLERLAAELRQQHGIRADVLAVDLTLSSSVQRIADALGHRLDEVAVLINNAGFGLSGAFVKQSEQELVELMQLNMTTLVQLCRRVLPGMQARRSGRILNVSSTAAFQPGPGFAVYCATKSFVLSFSEALAHEVRGLGITVTCLAPGPVETEFASRATMHESPLFRWGKMSVRQCVNAGYRAMQRGRRLKIPGLFNHMLAFGTRISPRRLTTALASWMLGRRWRTTGTSVG
ncbi:MAG: SDR family NAD(P)-dependent oxidoreductase [Planctomycetaceae bacterium]